MAAIINADDGVISGASGLKLSSDTSGDLNIQTNGVTAIAISASQVVSFPATTTITFGSLNVTNLTATTVSVSAATYLATASGNVGIGTSSPSYKFDVSGIGNFGGANPTLYIQPTTNTNNALLRCVNAGGTAYVGLDNNVAGLTANYALNLYHSGAYPINFSTNGTLQATITSSGNLGLGGTPSNWQSGRRVLQIVPSSTQGHVAFNGTISNISTNAYVDATDARWEYIGNGLPALYQQDDARHFWYTAASGTAGGAITWTQAMALNPAANNVLDLKGTGSGLSVVAITNNGTASASFGCYANGYGGGSNFNVGSNGAFFGSTAGAPLGVGTIDNYDLYLGTNNSERARITTGGDLYVGASSPQGNTPRVYLTKSSQGNSANNVLWVNDSASSATAALHVWSFSQTTVPSAPFVDAYYNGTTTLAIKIAGNGNITNINGSYGTISDQKLKQDIVDAGSQWSDIKSIRFRKYRMKSDVEVNSDAPAMIGVVAQELEQVCPGLIEEYSDQNNSDVKTKSVKTSVLLMKAAVALQEAMARIESLEAKVAALEVK